MNYKEMGIKYAKRGNYKGAMTYLQKAIKEGDKNAIVDLGVVYEKMRDYENAHKCYEYCARFNPVAAHNLGNLYEMGKGVKVDYKYAMTLYELSANNGYYFAYHKMAWILEHGLGMEADKKAAFEYELKAYQGECDSPLGDGECACNLGYYYERGVGTEQNYEKAVECYEQGYKLGDLYATYNLAIMYIYGYGVEKDIEHGVTLLFQAGRNGLALACEKLYELYSNEEYGIKDEDLATHWLYEALNNGSVPTFLLYAEMCLKGENPDKQVDTAEAEKAIEDFLKRVDPSYQEEIRSYELIKKEFPNTLNWEALEKKFNYTLKSKNVVQA